MKEIIHSDRAPAAIGPYSQAVRAGDFLHLSGQIGLVPSTGEMVGPDTTAQTGQCLRNLESVLAAAGATLEQAVQVTVFLADLDDFVAMNQVYAGFFPERPPARVCIQAARLPREARVEIALVAYLAD